MEPSPEYQPLMKAVTQKMALCKLVIEFLAEEFWQKPTYEDLLQRLNSSGQPDLTEEVLMRHAHFVCDQVASIDSSGDDDENLLITAPCMRALVKMAGVTFQKRRKMRAMDGGGVKKTKTQGWSKATTTTLVHELFESFFADQIDKSGKNGDKGPRKKRCGICEACQSPDCGQCTYCRDMLKFGGTGRTKQACKVRR